MKWLAFAALALATVVPHAAWTKPDSAPPAPTAADFGAVPFMNAPKLSPDGSHFAARAVIAGKVSLVVAQAGTLEGLRKFNISDGQQLEWYRWAGNAWVLMSLSQSDKFYDEDIRVTRLVAIDTTSGAMHVVGPKSMGFWGDDVTFVDPDGKFLLLTVQRDITEYPSVLRVDLASNAVTTVVKPRENVFSWFADSTGTVRVGLAVQDKRWWVYYRADGTSDFVRSSVRIFGGKDDKDDKDDVQTFTPVFGSDDGYAVALGKSGRFGLYHYDFKTDKIGAPIWENAKYDLDDFDLEENGAVRSVEFTDDRARIEWFDPQMKKIQAALDKAVPDATNRVISRSRDGQRMIVWSESAANPPGYMLFDRKTNHLDELVEPYDKIAGKALATMTSVSYAARDGLEIPAYLTLPLGKDPKNLPLVVMPHGGPFMRDSWGYDAWVQFLASKGYAVLQPNYRGSTGFGRDYVEKGNGQWGRAMQDDIDDGVKWLTSKGVADPKRVCIMGASFGGYAAMWAAVRNKDIYRCAISFAGISDVGAMLRYDSGSFSARRYFRDWRDRVRGDKKFDLASVSALPHVDALAVPILIAHGDKDTNVPYSQSRKLHEALLKLNREHEYVIYPGEGHGFDDPAHATDFLERVGKFLAKYNPS